MKKLRIVFMGTPEFAVPSLEILLHHHYDVVGVITAPDKSMGRGLKMGISPVKAAALKHNLVVMQPTNLKDPVFLDQLRSLNANTQVVVAFRMLPEVIWAMPEYGTFNLHASLLPNYRGAAPINWAIIHGEEQTGVTTFFLEKEIDTGHIIFQEKEVISPEDNAGTLYHRLMEKGAQLVLKTVQAIAEGNGVGVPQSSSNDLKIAPKLFRETCQINWNQPVRKVHDFVRGLAPYPAAWFLLQGKNCKVYKTHIVNEAIPLDVLQLGDYKTDHENYVYIKCQDGYIALEEVQLEGKKRLPVREFLRGYKL